MAERKDDELGPQKQQNTDADGGTDCADGESVEGRRLLMSDEDCEGAL